MNNRAVTSSADARTRLLEEPVTITHLAPFVVRTTLQPVLMEICHGTPEVTKSFGGVDLGSTQNGVAPPVIAFSAFNSQVVSKISKLMLDKSHQKLDRNRGIWLQVASRYRCKEQKHQFESLVIPNDGKKIPHLSNASLQCDFCVGGHSAGCWL